MISPKLSQNQPSKVDKNKTTEPKKTLNPLRIDGDMQQSISTKSLRNQTSKVQRNKTTETEEKTPNPLRKDGETEPRISPELSQN